MSKTDTSATGARTKPAVPSRLGGETNYDVDPGKGWVLFAGIMLALVGVINLAYGIAAISDSTFYVQDVKYVFGDLNLWGWFLTVVGAAQIVVAIGVFRGSEAARWAGVFFASCNIFVQFLILPAYPAWAIMVFFIDIIIIFGLVNYGGRDRHSLAA